MADPLLYIGATGAVALITAWATNAMAATTNRDSAEREAKRRVEEEERQAERRVEEEQRQAKRRAEEEKRQAIWQHRRDRTQAVLDFLDLAKRFVAGQDSMRSFEKMHAENLGGLADQLTLDELRKSMHEGHPSPSIVDLGHAFYVAISTAAPREVDLALGKIIEGLQPPQSAAASANVRIAIGEAEKTVEKYLVETESENA